MKEHVGRPRPLPNGRGNQWDGARTENPGDLISQRSGPGSPSEAGAAQRIGETAEAARNAFVTELDALRTAHGFTQAALAAAMGYSPSYISHIKAGRSYPTQPFARLADNVLGSGRILQERCRDFEIACRKPLPASGGVAAPTAPGTAPTPFPAARTDNGTPRLPAPRRHDTPVPSHPADSDAETLVATIVKLDDTRQGKLIEELFHGISDRPFGDISRIAAQLRRKGREHLSDGLLSIAGNRSVPTGRFGELAEVLCREGLIVDEAELARMTRRRYECVRSAMETGTGFRELLGTTGEEEATG